MIGRPAMRGHGGAVRQDGVVKLYLDDWLLTDHGLLWALADNWPGDVARYRPIQLTLVDAQGTTVLDETVSVDADFVGDVTRVHLRMQLYPPGGGAHGFHAPEDSS